MKYNIAFYCQSVPFSAETIKLEKSLGGSETALVYMANALAERGHQVTVFTQFQDEDHQGRYNGVKWADSQYFPDMCHSIEWDIFISQRYYPVMANNVRAKYRGLWVEDVMEVGIKAEYAGSLWQTDQILYVSEWQRQNYESILPSGAEKLGFVTKNGIDLATVDDNMADEKDPNQMIYISRPERGLFPLLQIFPQMREQRPDLELKVCRYYSMYENNPEVKRICEQADRMVAHTEGVQYLGNLNKEQLYQHISRSALMLYPGVPTFDETSCIAALEAQACRTPMVATSRGGLVETLWPFAGALIEGDAYSKGYQQEFIAQAFDLLDSASRYQEAQKMGREWVVDNYQYSTIAEEWEQNFDQFFVSRFQDHLPQIFDNLLHHDDFVTAYHIREEEGISQEQQDRLDSHLNQTHSEQQYEDGMLAPELEGKAVEAGLHGRLETVLQLIDPQNSQMEPANILDYGCGGGVFASALQRMFPSAQVLGIDFSQGIVDKGNQFIADQEWEQRKPHLHQADLMDASSLQEIKVEGDVLFSLEGQKYDLIFCGELLEHYVEPMELVLPLEDLLTDEGWLVWTVPNGPFVEMATNDRELNQRTHRIHWEYNTVEEVFSQKDGYQARYICTNNETGCRGLHKGHYVFRHQKGGQYGEIDFDKKAKLTRPYQKISVCMIAKNNEQDIGRCLESVKDVADEIILAHNQSTDGTVEIAKQHGAKIIELPEKWPAAPDWAPAPGNFSWMRNESVDPASGDWILWIDTDEQLRNGHLLGKYLQSRFYDGYVLRQVHLMVDADQRHDTPVRLYRNGAGFKFYGCIHEHAHKSLNEPIEPSFELPKTDIIHYGYVTEDIRQFKCKERNIGLLKLDRAVHPERLLGWVLLAREYINMVGWEKQENPNQPLSQISDRRLREVLRIYHDEELNLADLNGRYYKLIFPLYQVALKLLGVGFGAEIDVKVTDNGQAMRFLDQDDVEKHLQFQLKDLEKQVFTLTRDKTFLTQVEG